MNIKAKLKQAGIEANPLKDQFFLSDETILKQIADLGNLNKDDLVLEIGAGPGNLTKYLGQKAGKVIAFEIDKQFEPLLDKLPKNVEVHLKDAHKYAAQGGKSYKTKEYNKIISNLPYSIAEWLLHNLAFVEYDKVILTVPKKFYFSAQQSAIFTSFFRPVKKLTVPKEKFYPQPNSDSIVMDLQRLPKPLETRNLGLFLRQYMYQQEGWKVKNSLREGLIEYVKEIYNKQLTKNQARKIIKKVNLKKEFLENTPNTYEVYFQVGKKFNEKVFKPLIKNDKLLEL